jgi:site-specific DNA recombinase
MRTAIYCRLSKDRSGLSENVEIQRAECEDYAEEHGWQVVGVFTDNDISASRYSTKPRPGYNALLASVRAGAVEAILVTEMPRLYRRLEELLAVIHLAETTALRRIQPTEGDGYDLSTGEGIHNAVSAVNNAVLESRKNSDRTKRKKKARANQGVPNGGGRRPYGYTYIPAKRTPSGAVIEPGTYVVNQPEADVLGDAIELLLGGHSLRGTVAVLNERGHRTSTGGRWRTDGLRDILTGKMILGVRSHNGVEHPGNWPAIVDRDTWERVQLILTAEDRFKGSRRKGHRSYLLTGMIFCGACGEPGVEGEPSKPGAPLSGFGRTNNGVLERRYFCVPTDTSGAKAGCGKLGRLAEPLEALVSEAVLEVLDSPQMAEVLGAATQDQEMVELVDAWQGHKLKLEDLVADYASGLLNREQLAQAKEIVEAAMERTKARMDKLASSRALASVPPGQSFREAWAWAEANDDLDWRRQLVSLVVERVIVHPGHPGAHRWPDDDDPLVKRLGRQWHFDPTKIEIRWKL